MRRILFTLPLMFAGVAHADVWLPAEGIWQLDGANGSGLTLDVRDGTIGIALYSYDAAGKPTWYSGAGFLADGELHADIARPQRGGGPPAETRSLTLSFDSSTRGEMQLDDDAPIVIGHATFGADYIGGLQLASDTVTTTGIPDLRGRWLFGERKPVAELPRAIDVTLTTAMIAPDRVRFLSGAEGDADDQRYLLDCAPAATSTVCSLHTPRGMLGTPVPPVAQFAPESLSATRIADTESPWVAFRVPHTTNAPVSGIWQYVDTAGEGVTLDVRPDAIAVGVFGYDDAGAATWSLAVGALTTDTMSTDLLEFTGGSCLDCAHSPPNVARSTAFRIEFVDSTRAWLTLGDDEPRAIVLLPFGNDYLSAPISGDPDRDDFGPHSVPGIYSNWIFTAQTSIEAAVDDLSDARRFDVVLVSTNINNDGIASLAVAGALALESLGGIPGVRLQCTADVPTAQTVCDFVLEGYGDTPPPPPHMLGTFLPQDIAPMRISGIASDDSPLYLFRIPAMYNTPTQ